MKEGLPQSQVRCLLQDSRGFIWVGTLGGLSKFDSRVFSNYDRQDGLLNNQVNCITELNDGSIVAASNGSFSIINGLGLTAIPLEEKHRESTINALHVEGDQLMIGMEDGFLIFDLKQKTFVQPSSEFDAIKSAHIKAFHHMEDGRILFLTKEKLFAKSASQPIELIYQPQNPETIFFDLDMSADGRIWLASRNEGLVCLDNKGNFIRNFIGEISTNLITGVTVTSDNHVWMTSRYGFFEYDGNNFETYSDKSGLNVSDVRDLIEDHEGNIWIGTYGGGLSRFTGRVFSSYTTDDGLTSNAVMSIVQDVSGDYWFSTFDRGVCKLSADTIVQFSLREWTDNNRIWTSILDHEGALWFGSSDGLFRYHNNEFKLFTDADSLSHTMVLSLFEDNSHRIWIGTNKGLTIYNDGKFSKVSDHGSPQKKVRCIKQDKGGYLWFATIDGVYRFDGIAWRNYSQKDGLAENSTNCIEIDPFNRIWVGSQNGIALMSGDQFQPLIVGENSGSNVINFIRSAGEKMWLGTNSGLFSVELSTDLQTQDIAFRSYGLYDGLRSLETNLNAVYYPGNNQLWFGTTDGVTKINLDELNQERRKQTPQLVLTDVRVNLQKVDWKKNDVKFDEISGLAISPAFGYKQNHITFYFSGISTTYPENVIYQYMLEGLDEDWKAPTTADFATYSNLPFRDFIFKIRSKNGSGEWSETLSYSFSIKPPFWLTWWFIALEAILAISIISFIIYNRRRAIIAKREKEWFEIRSRMLALEQQSLNSSMNRHFIFNALNSIQYYINRQDRVAANRYLSDFARLIRKNLDSSQDNLTTLRDEIERLELYLKLEHMRFRDKFNYQIIVDPVLNQDQIKVPAMLIQPFLENSIWHGLLPKEGAGEVSVNIHSVGENLEFTISDNGIGIENSLKNKTTTDNHISKGMEITQNRIELIKKTTGLAIELRGPQQVQGDDGLVGGTEVRLKLPINFHEHFSQ